MKTFAVCELKENIDEILRLVQEKRESIQITNAGEVIAYLDPTLDPHSLPDWMHEKPTGNFWSEFDRIAAQIGTHWQGEMSAVDAVREARGEW